MEALFLKDTITGPLKSYFLSKKTKNPNIGPEAGAVGAQVKATRAPVKIEIAVISLRLNLNDRADKVKR